MKAKAVDALQWYKPNALEYMSQLFVDQYIRKAESGKENLLVDYTITKSMPYCKIKVVFPMKCMTQCAVYSGIDSQVHA